MELRHACEQLGRVANLFGRITLYRGYSASAVAYTALWALTGSAVEFLRILGVHPHEHVVLWVAIAIIAAFPVAIRMLWTYYHAEPLAQENTRSVVSHFVTCLIAGAIVTVALISTSDDVLARLPGLWMVLFSWGIFASRPYLPQTTIHAAFFYLIAGGLLLWIARQSSITPFLAMGPIFFIGQLFTAWIFHWHLERTQE
jgi:hypothetical protein